jgi:hypothetical protein
MRHPVNPGLEAAASVKEAKTSPKLDVNILKQVAAAVRVGFIATGEPL